MPRAPRINAKPVAALAAAVVAAAVVLGACGPSAGMSRTAADGPAVTVAQAVSSPSEDVASALVDPLAPGLPEPLVDVAEIRSGGPPPDGIPAIDEPRFHVVEDVGWLRDNEPVLVLDLGGQRRIYPVQVMTWHEVVNDTVAGVPVAVTYCPLCNSAVAFDRRVAGRVLDFGTSGSLYRSALVMYDRQTESLWAHFTGEAVAGVLTGEQLERFGLSTVSWATARETGAGALVLSRDTGFSRDYGRNPYPGYDDVNTSPFLFDGPEDGRVAAKTRVVGIEDRGEAVAVVTEALIEAGVIEVSVGGRELTVWLEPGTASALDTADLASGRDVGATGVFDPTVEGRRLSFERGDGGFVDRETSSTWNILGEAVAGDLAGARLDPLTHVDTFWFAWAAYLPDTRVVPLP